MALPSKRHLPRKLRLLPSNLDRRFTECRKGSPKGGPFFVMSPGKDPNVSLQSVTEELRKRIGTGGEFGRSVKFDFGADGLVLIDDKASPAVVSNSDGPSDCSIYLSLQDFKEIATGNQTPQMAFMLGKIRVEGDMSVALQLGSILG